MLEQQRNPNLSLPERPSTRPNEVMTRFGDQWWTGLKPEKCLPGYDQKTGCLRAVPLLNLNLCSREDVLCAFDNSWTLTEVLFSSLKDEKTYFRPPYHQLRHPPIFYYGHPAVLFINKMRLAGLIEKPIDLYLEKILETGVDEMSWDDMSKNEMQWPSLATVHAYRKKAYQAIRKVIETHPDLETSVRTKSLGWDHPLWSVFMGIEHEKIHFETSSVLFRELPLDLVETPSCFPPLASTKNQKSEGNDNPWLTVNRVSTVTLGKDRSAPSYGWDNEYGKSVRSVKPFQIQQNLVSNREYYEFVKSFGYIDDQYWTSEGLAWRKFRNSKRPCFWVSLGPEGSHDYGLRTLFDVIPMPWDWPAEVNFHEAQAYCRWRNKKDSSASQFFYRLPTEAEHHALREDSTTDPVLQNQTPITLQKLNENFNFQLASPRNVQEGIPNSKGVRDLFGNVWQWHLDHFHPLNQFSIHPLYDDFSTPCFDGRHQMILGGSFMSCGHEASRFARFHFRPHFFQHAGFRMAATLDGSTDNGAVLLDQDPRKVHGLAAPSLAEIKQSNPQGWWKNVVQPLEDSVPEIEGAWRLTVEALLHFEKNRKQISPSGSQFDFQKNRLVDDFQSKHPRLNQFPRKGTPLAELLKHIQEDIAPVGGQPGHPGYMAYVAGAGNSLAPMAQALAMTYNQFTGHHSLSPGFVEIEREVIDWMIKMVGYDSAIAGGYLTSGGSLANHNALAFARNQMTKTTDQAKLTFYASSSVHHCIGKGLSFLGVPPESLRLIPVDSQLKMDVEKLSQWIQEDRNKGLEPVAVIATFGSTTTGTIDPLESIAKICEKEKLWLHIDAAYGGFFLLTEEFSELKNITKRADSIALDPHKSLSTPYGTGCLLVKQRTHMSAMNYRGSKSYMPPEPSQDYDYADVSLELSRDPRGLRLWLPLMFYGIEPFILNLEEKRRLAQFAFEELSKIPELEVIKSPELSIVNFRARQREKTTPLLAMINSTERFFLTPCELDGVVTIRICLLGFRSHFPQVEQLIKQIRDLCQKL